MTVNDFREMATAFCSNNSDWSHHNMSIQHKDWPRRSKLYISNDGRVFYRRSGQNNEQELKGFAGIGDLLLLDRMMHGNGNQ